MMKVAETFWRCRLTPSSAIGQKWQSPGYPQLHSKTKTSWSNEEQQTLGNKTRALCPSVTAAAAAERTLSSFDGDDASVHERGGFGLSHVKGWSGGRHLWHGFGIKVGSHTVPQDAASCQSRSGSPIPCDNSASKTASAARRAHFTHRTFFTPRTVQ